MTDFFYLHGPSMYLLYADESGSIHDPNQEYFILAGFCTFERQAFWLANELDGIAARFNPADPASVELHGNPMTNGKGLWRRYSKQERLRALEDCLHIFASSHSSNRLFASVIKKTVIAPRDPVEYAF